MGYDVSRLDHQALNVSKYVNSMSYDQQITRVTILKILHIYML